MSFIDNYLEGFHRISEWDEAYREHYLKKLVKMVPNRGNITELQQDALKQISVSFLAIESALSIFKEYGIKYNFGLAGGAVRDLICSQTDKTNDFDIILNFPQLTPGYQSKNWETLDELNKKGINIEALWMKIFPEFELKEISKDTLPQLVNRIMKDKHNTDIFLNKKSKVKDYQNSHIDGIIQVSGNDLPKKLDLILSPDRAIDFMNTFSFDICKGYIQYSNVLELKEVDGYLNILDHLMISKHMIHDIERKQLTMNIGSLTESHLHYYMSKHYLKMKEKFPDFKLNYRDCTVMDQMTQQERTIHEDLVRLARHYVMQENVPVLRDDSKKLKI